ncbi:hypothetical protein SLA2020_153520 [Shorea laevis]
MLSGYAPWTELIVSCHLNGGIQAAIILECEYRVFQSNPLDVQQLRSVVLQNVTNLGWDHFPGVNGSFLCLAVNGFPTAPLIFPVLVQWIRCYLASYQIEKGRTHKESRNSV